MPNRSFRARALSIQVASALSLAILPGAIAAQGATAAAAAASVPAVTPSQLADITDRGRALAGYQRAVWRAYAQLLATRPDPRLVQRYIAYHADSGWVVAFGRLSVTRDTFYVSSVAIPAVVNGRRVDTLFTLETPATPGADTDYLVRAARAIDTATALFWPSARPYEAAVLPAADGSWWVYVIPAANRAGVWPLGDDMRYRISADGRAILEARRMHVGVIEYDRTLRQEDTRFTAGVHNTLTSEVPEDTDVYHVLTRQPRVFEYVFTPRSLYMINEDGSIRFVLARGSLIGTSP
jgi:hypothetical protein